MRRPREALLCITRWRNSSLRQRPSRCSHLSIPLPTLFRVFLSLSILRLDKTQANDLVSPRWNNNFKKTAELRIKEPGRAWWLEPVIPTTWEAEAGGNQYRGKDNINRGFYRPIINIQHRFIRVLIWFEQTAKKLCDQRQMTIVSRFRKKYHFFVQIVVRVTFLLLN